MCSCLDHPAGLKFRYSTVPSDQQIVVNHSEDHIREVTKLASRDNKTVTSFCTL